MNIPYLSNIANPNDYANSVVNINSISLNGNCGNNLPQLIQMLPCQDNFPLTGNEISMVRTYQVSNTLTISGNYSVNSGMNITFFAGNSIAMTPNTHLRSGSAVLARIQACPTPASRISNAVSEEISTKLFIESKLLIYPNPTKDWVTVSLDSKIKIVNITSIIDGKIIYSNNNVSDFTHQLNSSGFAKGMYIITATNYQGKTFTEKMFKN
jgi:hypothetical protein